MKWYEKLERNEKREVNMMCGALNLPSIDEYQTLAHFLNDVRSRTVEAHSLISQASQLLGEEI